MSSLIEQLWNKNEVETVKTIQFGMFSPEEIERGSVVEIDSHETYDNTGNPKIGGLFDPRMGIIEKGKICVTCENTSDLCPGHFGHINLGLPVYNINYLNQWVIKILRSVCVTCSNLLVDKNDPNILEKVKEMTINDRFKFITDLAKKNNICQYNNGCNRIQPKKISKQLRDSKIESNVLNIYLQYDKEAIKDVNAETKYLLSASQCYDIFSRITDEDVDFMGLSSKYSRPEWMITTKILIPPPSVRPSIRQSNNQRSEDDLTYALTYIVRTNNDIKKKLHEGADKKVIDDLHGALQYYYMCFLNNEISNIQPLKQRSGRVLKTLTKRLKAKEGRVRGNIMGKRVDFSARTVISCGPNLSIDEYGVPKDIAMNMTVSEKVTKYNKEKLYKLVRNGPDNYPGAKSVTKITDSCTGTDTPCTISLKYYSPDKVILNEGDIVNRHVMDGDIGLFNRQPSLHRLSMISMKIKVVPHKTFRLNVFDTTGFNADFDGDEMNMHLPQSIITSTELEEITLTTKQLISPASSKPIVHVVQDTMIGSFLMSQEGVYVTKQELFNLMMKIKNYNGKIKKTLTGKDAFSIILPDISLKRGGVDIINGKIISGVLSKALLGGKPDALLQNIHNLYGSEECKNFLNNIQNLITKWLVSHGFSIGFSDTIPNEKIVKNNKKILDEKINNSWTLIEKINTGIYNPNLDEKYLSSSFEADIKQILEDASSEIENYIKNNIDKTNRIYQTVTSGSKGSMLNIRQILGCVGQQIIVGERVPMKFTNRTLPHFTKFDDGPASRGFVKNSYINGLTPDEFFFHQMGGRIGSIDTAIKSVTGDTPIVIIENNKTKRVLIGDWIDKKLKDNENKVEHYEEREMELLKVNKMFIPTTDRHGNVSWGEITAITRHDPGKELYKIKTLGGKSVIVTESKSLLIWQKDTKTFERVDTPLVKEGDFVPVTQHLPEPPIINDSFDDYELNKDFGEILANYLLDLPVESKYENILNKETENKTKIPDFCYSANTNFIKGMLKTLIKNNIVIDLNSKSMINSISMLFTRLNIFGKVIGTKLYIENGWLNILSNKLDLELDIIEKHRNFDFKNDVILDKIVSIEKVDVKLYPKVYDLTIPSTLNFGLANGLHVVDTAESGYIQRRLVKSMEDLSVRYDGTVRNAYDNIVQFIYGDDNMDPVKVELHKLMLIRYTNEEMKENFNTDNVEWKDIVTKTAFKNFSKNYKTLLKENYEELEQYRKELRDDIYKNQKTMIDKIFTPVNYFRLIHNSLYKFNVYKTDLSNLTPQYIVNNVNDICSLFSKYITKSDDFKLFKILIKSNLSIKQCLVKYRMNKVCFDYIIDKCKMKIISSIIQPGEMVGCLAAQSIGEPSTQLTLNSVDWEEQITVIDDGNVVKKPIGELIDSFIDIKGMKANSSDPEKGDLIYVDLTHDNIKVPSVNEEGVVSLEKVLGYSRHLPINKDGSNTLLKVTTDSGKTVVATKAKSFLIYKEGKVVGIRGDELKLGMKLPIMTKMPELEINDTLDMSQWFPKNKYIYKSELDKAKAYRDEVMKSGSRYWFKRSNGHKFTIPYSRADSVTEAFKKDCYDDGKFYCKGKRGNGMVETVKLDKDFGFFIGAYLAEGCVTKNYIAIANNDKEYLTRIELLMKKFKIGYHITVQENKGGEGWTSTDLRIHSKILATFINKECGKGSSNKFIPSWCFNAPDEFVSGLLDGYYSGDGCVPKKDRSISCSSVSEKLIDDLSHLLTRFGIYSKKFKPKKATKNNRGSKNIKQHWKLFIRNGNIVRFNNNVTFTIKRKQERLDKHCIGMKSGHGKKDYLEGFVNDGELRQKCSDLYFSEVIKIEEVEPTHTYVYDLTVENTKNFILATNVACRDTFHTAGHAGKSVVTTTGVPRLNEIINLSKSPKTPSTTVYLNSEYADDKMKALEIMNKIQYTIIKDIVKETEIIFENDESEILDEDYEFIQTFVDFKRILDVKDIEDDNLSKWVLRIIFDKEVMLSKNIKLVDIYNLIERNNIDNSIQVIINDDNSKNLVMRLKTELDSNENDNFNFLKTLEQHILNLKIRGIEGIKKSGMYQTNRVIYNSDGSFVIKKEWTLDTNGLNLSEIMSFDMVDQTRTISNSFQEVYEMFGIEVVRQMIINEMNEVLSGAVTYRHLSLLADIMTYQGYLMSIFRNGINNSDDVGPIGKASFEETEDMLFKASAHGKIDNMQGSSANVMMAQFTKAGTSAFNMLINEEMIMNIDTEGYEETKINTNIEDEIDNIEIDDDVSDSEFDFNYVPNIKDIDTKIENESNDVKIV